MAQISLLVRIDEKLETVFEQVATAQGIAKWFTEATLLRNQNTGQLQLQLWGETDFIITELIPSSRIIWHCTSTDNPWFGTDVCFSFREDQGKTIVSFDHRGWDEVSDLFRDCAMSWAYFLESLCASLETGQGTPEGIAPPCDTP